MKRIAVLMTCYNRKNNTLKALDEIYNQKNNRDFVFEIYLVDDSSTDGTKEAVSNIYPTVKIIEGNGNLFWNGGMRAAFNEAKKYQYDYYIWMNDDTFINKSAFNTLYSTYNKIKALDESNPVIIVGTTMNDDGVITYGGVKKHSKTRPVKYNIVHPNPKQYLECDTINGNIVLIDKTVYELVNNLDPIYIHSMGDFDFGLRAKEKGAKIYVAPNILGVCERNPKSGTYNDTSLSLGEGIKKLLSIKGLPLKQWYIFTKRHAGIFWLLYFVKPYFEYVPKFIIKKILKF